jgi:hypothetical protein
MNRHHALALALAAVGFVGLAARGLDAAGQCGCGACAKQEQAAPGAQGMRGMSGMQGMPGMAGAQGDMQLFHRLLASRDQIRREVVNLSNGIDTVTRSDNTEVAGVLKTHVAAMVKRVEDGRAIHARDPLFAELFRQAKHIAVKVEELPDGVHVVETSDDPYTVTLLHQHADVVNLFIERGMSEMHRDHPVQKQP